jgi:hypothetical protein
MPDLSSFDLTGKNAFAAAGRWSDFNCVDRVHELRDRAVPCAEHAEIHRQRVPAFRQAALARSRLGDCLAGV